MTDIMKELDSWVSQRGTGNYIPADYTSEHVNFGLHESFGIQQERNEIKEFIAFLQGLEDRYSCLEIGLGYYGSTHFIWRHLFDRVLTVEYQRDRIFQFRNNMANFYGKHVLDDGKSSFFFGLSNETHVISKVKKDIEENTNSPKLDMLFIDGDHEYISVLTDWMIYKHFVKPGGLIAFHDSVSPVQGAGVKIFLEELQSGKLDGKTYDIKQIVSSKECGIAYYFVDG